MTIASEPSARTARARSYSGAELPEPVGGSVPTAVGATVGPVVGPGIVVGAAQSGAIVMLWACVALKLGCVESTTITVKSKAPAAVGVPVIAPVAGSRVRPGGRVPDATDQVNGGVPPSTLSALAE